MWDRTVLGPRTAIDDALATCDRARRTRARSRAARGTAMALMVHSVSLRGGHRFSGASDLPHRGHAATLAALVTSCIFEHPTCAFCLAAKSGGDLRAVLRTLERIGETVTLDVAYDERCRACGSSLAPVYSLKREA